MARNKIEKEVIKPVGEKITCVKCQKTMAKDACFSHRNKFIADNLSICKECANQFIEENDLATVISLLRFLDIPLYMKRWEGVVEKGRESILGRYLRQMAMSKNKYFDNGDVFSMNEENNKLLEEIEQREIMENSTEAFTESDLEIQDDVIRLLGYDPFVGYTDEDKKYLYSNIFIYLNEDTLEDGIKLSSYLQIVNNNNQIRKIDLAISSLNSNIKSMVENAKDIGSLQDVKSKIVTSNDKIMKENSISVKNRGDKKAGTTTLTGRMRMMRELKFDEAEEDFYSQKIARGMAMVADISNKSLIDQLRFDENDYTDIIKTQRDKFIDFEKQILELNEKNRLLEVKIIELKNEDESYE